MITLGRHSYIGEPHNITCNVQIGNFTSIAPHVQIHNLPQHHRGISLFPLKGVPEPKFADKPISIGSDVWIGQGAILLNGITVGDGAIIGSYAVVAHNVEPYSVQVGNPAKIISYRFSPEYIKKLLKIQWWEWTDAVIDERLNNFMLPIDAFTAKYL